MSDFKKLMEQTSRASLSEGVPGYFELKDKIAKLEKSGIRISDVKHSSSQASYVTVDGEGYKRKYIFTSSGTKVENMGQVKVKDDDEDEPKAKSGRGRPKKVKEDFNIDEELEGDNISEENEELSDDSELAQLVKDAGVDINDVLSISDEDFNAEIEAIDDFEDIEDLYDDDEFEQEEEGDISEVLSTQARMRKAQQARRNKSKLQSRRKLQLKRTSTPQRLDMKARRQAIRMLHKKILKNRDYSKLPAGEKVRVDKIVQRLRPVINRMVPKLRPKIKSAEQQRIRNANKPKK